MKFKTLLKLPFLFLKFYKDGGFVKLNVSYVNPSNRFMGKNVFVSGGTSGIGLAVTKAFLSEGANVIIAARKKDQLEQTKMLLQNPNLHILEMDISDVKSIKNKIDLAAAELSRIDIFVNCAGVSAYDESLQTEKMYDYICNINQKGLYFMNKEEGDYFITNQIQGKIINLTSKAGERIGFDPYTLSKWGANSITKGNARRLAPYHINVNGIAPGRVPTNITKELQNNKNSENVYTPNHATKRFTMPEEVAATALFLASDSANNIVGQVIVMDGGSYN